VTVFSGASSAVGFLLPPPRRAAFRANHLDAITCSQRTGRESQPRNATPSRLTLSIFKVAFCTSHRRTELSDSEPRHKAPDNAFAQKKNGSVTATKLGTTNKIFVAATKNFAAATKQVDRTKHFVVVTKYFCNPYFNK